jgi:trimeric autotransporter adhesin
VRTLLVAFLLLGGRAAAAQSDTLLHLQASGPGTDRLVVDASGVLVASGTLFEGTVHAAGSGARMVWAPGRAAFRAGHVWSDEWDHASLGHYSVAFGERTRASGNWSVAMGDRSVASGVNATALGWLSVASGFIATAIGTSTLASGSYSTAIGHATTASGGYSTAVGTSTSAVGAMSTALGVRARAAHAGSFVWGSTTTAGALPTDSLVSSATGEFSVRAVGGVRMFTNQAMTSGVTLAAGGSAWNVVSDRLRKENFAVVDGEDVLRRLRSVPVTSWNYLAEGAGVRHIGPIAQDWHAAFALSADSLTINQGDFDGVNLAAIQALDGRTRNVPEMERELARLREEVAAGAGRLREVESENAALRGEVAALGHRLHRVEALLAAHSEP